MEDEAETATRKDAGISSLRTQAPKMPLAPRLSCRPFQTSSDLISIRIRRSDQSDMQARDG